MLNCRGANKTGVGWWNKISHPRRGLLIKCSSWHVLSVLLRLCSSRAFWRYLTTCPKKYHFWVLCLTKSGKWPPKVKHIYFLANFKCRKSSLTVGENGGCGTPWEFLYQKQPLIQLIWSFQSEQNFLLQLLKPSSLYLTPWDFYSSPLWGPLSKNRWFYSFLAFWSPILTGSRSHPNFIS